jgi:hypothetical protein
VEGAANGQETGRQLQLLSPKRKPKSSQSGTDKLKTARGRPKRRPRACFSHCRFLFLLLGLLVSRLRGFVGLPGMLMGRRRVFLSVISAFWARGTEFSRGTPQQRLLIRGFALLKRRWAVPSRDLKVSKCPETGSWR